MTDKQLDQLCETLKEPLFQNTILYDYMSKVCSCIDMINSLIAYNRITLYEDPQKALTKSYVHHYLEDYIEALTETTVINLIQDQQNDIECIRRNVATDSEGCTYNSIIWKNNK